eukprot:COSAG01_NODE_4632_length_4861_cov_2.222596_5_plen_45_part_00
MEEEEEEEEEEEGGELSPETSFLAGIGSESDDAPTPSECCWQQV